MRVATQCQSTTPTKAFLPHQRVTTEVKSMEDEIEEFDEHPQDDMSQYQDYPYEYDY
ncbi:hypothetical protein [Enterobacter hormaechei]|uniref:hypothetical protein n=1 Tax=Enterobacter hormaechei TaxID=158836 RepID=UPI002876E491|nr:hypothetical protein [Enterobacter hormaechei]MDS0952254.1 hypothetical protein [Enterobacter hormaechei]